MHKRISLSILAVIAIVSLFSLLTFQVLSYSQKSNLQSAPNPTITLILPDQTYSLTQFELLAIDSELVIPTHDKSSPKAIYSKVSGTVEAEDLPQDYVVDLTSIRQELESLSDQESYTITPTYSLRDRSVQNLDVYNQQLENIHQSPLIIRLKNGVDYSELPISSSLLRTLLVPTTIELSTPPTIDADALLTYLDEQLTAQQKKYFNPTTTVQNTQLAINKRFLGDRSNQAILGVDDGATSHGELADRYLEIDLSQQKMYFFIGGKLYKQYRVSTGKDYPTPVGDFHILNKAPKAFSDIYNVWMPYWMAFSYANDIGAYLGIHEIAYATDDFGKPFYKHGYYIGDMMTGGCIAMEPKDSREIYDLSSVGMLLRVVP